MSSLALLMQNYSDSEDENKSNDDENNKKKIKLINDEIKQENIKENDRYSSNSSLNSSKSIDLSLNFNFKKDIQESIEQIEVSSDQTKCQEINNSKVVDSEMEITHETEKDIENDKNDELIIDQDSNDDVSNEIEGGQYSPKSFNRLLLGLDPGKIKLPKMPKNKSCPDSLIEKITHLHNLMKQGKNMNEIIQEKKSFRNPSIYEKLISYCDIDEFGTNLPTEVYNPPSFEEKDSFQES